MKRLSILLLILVPLVALGGCAMEPAYRYNANAGGGYYQGQSAYGNASTVVYGSTYVSPWGAGWYPGWGATVGYGPGWWGYGNVGFGATYVYRPHRHYRDHYRRNSHTWHQGHARHHDNGHRGNHHHRGHR